MTDIDGLDDVPSSPDVEGLDGVDGEGISDLGDLADTDTSRLSWPLVIAPGQVAEVPVLDGAAGIALKSETGDERWLIVLASTELGDIGGQYDYTLERAAMPWGLGDPVLADGCSIDSAPWAATPRPDELAPEGEGPTLGERRTFVVPAGIFAFDVDFEAIAVGERAVVWADVSSEHPALLEAMFVDEFRVAFEYIVLPRIRQMSGVESDFDGNGRIHLLFTPLTYESAVAFFMSCDLGAADCGRTNAGEILYLTPPNSIPPPYNTSNAIKEILAHELGHLIGYNRSVLRNGLDGWLDNAYVLEGIGALAQDVSGYQSGNFYVTKAGLDGIDEVSLADVLLDEGRYITARDGALRGAAYLFVRWLYDRGGGDAALMDGTLSERGGTAFARALQDHPLSVANALPALVGHPLTEVVMDFYTALAVSNREDDGGVAPQNPCFAYLPTALDPLTERQRGANVFTQFHGQRMMGPATSAWDEADGVLRAGGVEYLVVQASAVGLMEFALAVDAAAHAHVRVARLR